MAPCIGDPRQALVRLCEDARPFEQVFYPVLFAYPDSPARHLVGRLAKVATVDAVIRRNPLENDMPLAAKILAAGVDGLSRRCARFDESRPG